MGLGGCPSLTGTAKLALGLGKEGFRALAGRGTVGVEVAKLTHSMDAL